MTDLISEYYKNLKKTIYQYAILASKIVTVEHKKILNSKKRIEEVLENVINIYVDKYLFSEQINLDISKILITSPYVDIYSLEKEISAISDYFISNNKVFDIAENEKDVILLAALIKIANEIDLLSSPYVKGDIKFNKVVSSRIERYHKIDFIFLIDQGRKNTKLLIETAKTNARLKAQFFETLTNPNSFNKYIDITNNNDYYIAQYNFYVDSLEKYNNKQTKKIYKEKNIDDRFVMISADYVALSIIKALSIRTNPGIYFLPVKSKFLLDNKNIKEIKKILESKTLKKQLKLLINYDDCSKELLEVLIKNELEYFIYYNRKTPLNEGLLKINQKYVLGREFNKNNHQLLTKLKNGKYYIVEETYDAIVDDNSMFGIKSEEII